MKKIATMFLAVLLAACGGGGDDDVSAMLNGGVVNTGLGVCGVEAGFSEVSGRVSRVVDGDTFDLESASGTTRVRLLVIDAPESNQAYGKEAKDSLVGLIDAQTVRVGTKEKDVYGRTLGLVFDSKCSLINLRMTEMGGAWFNRAYANDVPREIALALENGQAIAMMGKRGLWSLENPVAPWVFRE